MILALLLACDRGGADDDAGACTPDPDGWRPTWANFGEAFFTTWCDACHAAATPQRFGAPESWVFDDEAQVRAALGPIRTSVLGEAPTMPFGGGVPDAELAHLARYLDCLEAE